MFQLIVWLSASRQLFSERTQIQRETEHWTNIHQVDTNITPNSPYQFQNWWYVNVVFITCFCCQKGAKNWASSPTLITQIPELCDPELRDSVSAPAAANVLFICSFMLLKRAGSVLYDSEPSAVITTRAQKLLERFNLTYFHCSNKQSGWCQMQKMLLNNWSVIEANIHDETSWSERTRGPSPLCDDCNKNVWRCGGNWPRQDVNVHAVLCQLLKCEVKQTKD